MKVEDNKKIVKIIETNKGYIYSPFSNRQATPKLTIFNQIFTSEPSKIKSNIPLDLEHLNFHKQSPYSLQNTSLGWASIQHQLRQLLTKTNLSQNEVLIFESSSYNEKIPQIFNRFQLVKGYNYRIKLQSLQNISEDKVALMNQQHVLKQIEMEFSLGNGTFKPGYIGQINFDQIQSPILQGIIKAYLNYAAKNQCPIVINFASEGQQTYNIVFEQDSKKIIDNMERKLKILDNFLRHGQLLNCSKNIIIYNLPIILINKNNFQHLDNYFAQHIQNAITAYNITLGFKLLQYSKYGQKDGINEIIKILKKYQRNIILSSGIKYKTDLSLNSGQGLSLYEYQNISQSQNICHMNSVDYIKHFVDEQLLDKVVRGNVLQIFDWKEKKQQIKIQIFWKCDYCNKDSSETIKAFGKFGKQFCCIKCLKSYKF